MRFAGDALNKDTYGQILSDGNQRLIEPAAANTYPQVIDTPAHLTGQPGFDQALLPNGEQGPAQGPNIPIKNYGGKYMPDATQPSGYRPGPLALGDPFPPKHPGRYSFPKGMPGVVDPTYPVDSPLYGQPIDSPVHPGRPMEMNKATYEGLQDLYNGKGRPYIPGR